MNRSSIFLRCYRETGSVTKAAEAADISRSIHYRRLANDPKYAAAFAEAHEEAIAVLEDEAIRRAVEGVDEPVVYKGSFQWTNMDDDGNPVGKPLCIRKYSDSLLQFLLRGARPEKYRERFSGEIASTVSHKFEGSLEDLLKTYHRLTAQENDTPQA